MECDDKNVNKHDPPQQLKFHVTKKSNGDVIIIIKNTPKYFPVKEECISSENYKGKNSKKLAIRDKVSYCKRKIKQLVVTNTCHLTMEEIIEIDSELNKILKQENPDLDKLEEIRNKIGIRSHKYETTLSENVTIENLIESHS